MHSSFDLTGYRVKRKPDVEVLARSAAPSRRHRPIGRCGGGGGAGVEGVDGGTANQRGGAAPLPRPLPRRRHTGLAYQNIEGLKKNKFIKREQRDY